MKKLANISLVVCTKNRPKSINRLIKSLNRQSVLPKYFIIVNDVQSSPSLPLSTLKSINHHISTKYFEVKYCSIPLSRNFAFTKCHTPIFISVDDDIILPKTYLATIEKLHQLFPQKMGFVCKINALHHDPISLTGQYIMNGRVQDDQALPYTHTAAYSLNYPLFKKLNLNFDNRFATGEDLDFFIRLNQAGYPIYSTTKTSVFHDFNSHPNGLLRYVAYGKDLIKLSLKHPLQLNYFWCLPQRKLDFIFFIPLFINNTIRLTYHHFKNIPSPIWLLPFVLMIKTALLTGILSSPEGIEISTTNFNKSFLAKK